MRPRDFYKMQAVKHATLALDFKGQPFLGKHYKMLLNLKGNLRDINFKY